VNTRPRDIYEIMQMNLPCAHIASYVLGSTKIRPSAIDDLGIYFRVPDPGVKLSSCNGDAHVCEDLFHMLNATKKTGRVD
jgi:hypothetical protein